MSRGSWLLAGAGLSFFMAACQAVISVWPAAAAYFGAPQALLKDRPLLFLVGEGATLVFAVFGLYALSGAGGFRRLPLLRLGLVGISSLYLLRGLFIVFTVLEILGILRGNLQVQGVISHLVFLAAGIAYTIGTASRWGEMRVRGADSLVFTSEAIENIPPGFRARETYRILGPNEFIERFEIAEPDSEFALYSETRFQRAK